MTLSQLLENHWLSCMATAGHGRITRLASAVVLTSPRLPGAFLNFILLRGADPEQLGPVLEAGRAILSAEGRPPALFLRPREGDGGALASALSRLGWRQIERQVVLARALPAGRPHAPPDVDVHEIGPDQLAQWGRLLVTAYEVLPEAGEAIRAAWGSLLAEPGEGCRSRLYLASVGAQAAGTGLTWIQGEVAGLYCGAVVPHLRRRGVERATVMRRLTDAASDGARLATVQTTPGSPVMHLCIDTLGFHLADEREVWLPCPPAR